MTVCCSVFVCTYGSLGHDWALMRRRIASTTGRSRIAQRYYHWPLGRQLPPTVAQSVAVFDFELIDTSLEGATRGARPDEQQRLARLSDQLRQLLRDSGRFSLVDITPIAREAQASNLQACGGCDIQLARRIGAELAITGTVQKVSNLILNMNVYVRDASSGATIAAMSADMRGNTDETWSRTLNWLVRNRLLAPGYGLQ